jgi:hypothetical protein
MSQRRAGTLYFRINGTMYDAKGNFSYNLGKDKREAIVGADKVHGYKSTPQVAFIEGEITDRGDLDLETLVSMDDATVTLELANGKVIALYGAWYASEGTAQTEEANIQARFEAPKGEEIRA